MTEMIPVLVDSIRVNLMGPQRLIILREINGERNMPIWVGPFEGDAIAMPLRDVETARPLTHALLKNVFKTLGATLKQVEIIALKEDIFYSVIVAEHQNQEIRIDARPSDAIALALYAHIPVLVAEEVLEMAGFLPESPLEITHTPSDSAPAQPKKIEPTAEPDRLSIFEDFLENLDADEDDQPTDEEDQDQ